MRPSRTVIAAAVLGLLPAAAIAAKSVYLNNVRIDAVESLRNLKLEKVTVRFDEKGDVFIDAPGYQVKLLDQRAGSGTSSSVSAAGDAEERIVDPKLTRRYFLVTEQNAPGMTEFDIDVYVNSKWIRKLGNGDGQIYTEITRHLTPGRNTVLLNARKLTSGSRKSYSPEHVFRVIIGEGNTGGNHVVIDRPLVDFKRTASDEENVSKEFSFVTR
jgi:hypothetical protein